MVRLLTEAQIGKNAGLFIHEHLFAKEIQDLKKRIDDLEKKP